MVLPGHTGKKGVSMMDNNELKKLLMDNWGKLLGAILGLLIGLLFLWYGFWRTLLIIIFLIGGIFAGIKLEKNTEFRNFLDKFLHH